MYEVTAWYENWFLDYPIYTQILCGSWGLLLATSFFQVIYEGMNGNYSKKIRGKITTFFWQSVGLALFLIILPLYNTKPIAEAAFLVLVMLSIFHFTLLYEVKKERSTKPSP